MTFARQVLQVWYPGAPFLNVDWLIISLIQKSQRVLAMVARHSHELVEDSALSPRLSPWYRFLLASKSSLRVAMLMRFPIDSLV